MENDGRGQARECHGEQLVEPRATGWEEMEVENKESWI